MYYTAEEALQKVKDYIPGSHRFRGGLSITHYLIIPKDEDVNPFLLQYERNEIDVVSVAERYGNGRNLQLYAVNLPL